MRVIFMGTPQFSVPIMQALAQANDVELVGVFTQPDSVSKRGHKTSPSPIKFAAAELGLCVHTPHTLKDEDVLNTIKELNPDAIVVASYGNILTQDVLDIPRYGCINVHASLLPRWRGAAPIERAILAGDELTGISIMRMESGLDTGSYCLQKVVQIEDKDSSELTNSLSRVASECIVEVLFAIQKGEVTWIEQDDSKSTYAKKIDKAEMMLSPKMCAYDNVLRVRASTEHAPARGIVCNRAMAITSARIFDPLVEDIDISGANLGEGCVARVSKRLLLGCTNNTYIEILTLKPDGKKQMQASDFCAGVHELLKSGNATWEAL